MEDPQIIELYWRRDERAIAETQKKYGPFCLRLARNILSSQQDAEECVSDACYQAWNAIPPLRPVSLRAWLGRVVRNLSLNRWNQNRAGKRYSGMETLLSELTDCIPSPDTVERTLEAEELGQAIGRWLRALSKEDRVLFVRRYWYGAPLKELARERGETPNRLAQRMYRLRGGLKQALEQEGITL